MTFIKLGSVRTFPDVKPDKAQALKVLEEASEVHGAWHVLMDQIAFYERSDEDMRAVQNMPVVMYATDDLMDEIADTIQALANLAAALGVTDLTPYLARCEERNRKRGRYDE